MASLDNKNSSVLEVVVQLTTPLNVAIALPALLLTYLVTNAIYDVYFHPLAKFPGPFLAKITRLWITWQCYKAREPYVLQELSKKYGTGHDLLDNLDPTNVWVIL